MSSPSIRSTDAGIALLRIGLGAMWIAHARQVALALSPIMAAVIAVHRGNGLVPTA